VPSSALFCREPDRPDHLARVDTQIRRTTRPRRARLGLCWRPLADVVRGIGVAFRRACRAITGVERGLRPTVGPARREQRQAAIQARMASSIAETRIQPVPPAKALLGGPASVPVRSFPRCRCPPAKIGLSLKQRDTAPFRGCSGVLSDGNGHCLASAISHSIPAMRSSATLWQLRYVVRRLSTDRETGVARL
jgi:hypothetical protein